MAQTQLGGGTSTADPQPAPTPLTMTNLWDLAAEPGRVLAAADAWRGLASVAGSARTAVDTPAATLRGDKWAGDASDTYHDHLSKLGADVTEAAQTAGTIAAALESAGHTLASVQAMLSDDLDRLSGSVPTTVSGGQVTCSPRTADDVATVESFVSAAQQLRRGLDEALLDQVGAIEKARPALSAVSGRWQAVASGVTDGWTLPPEANGAYLIYNGDDIILSTGSGDDTVRVTVDPLTGAQLVTVNGVTYSFPKGAHLTIRTGSGNDTVEVAPGTRLGFTLIGGSGDDKITGGAGDDIVLGLGGADTIRAGAGRDRVSGGEGRDYIDGGQGDDVLTGGLGDDTIYGMDGDDRISGGEGRDYLEGAKGNDTIDGNAGDDMISGGRGDDTIRGGAGADHVYTGAGTDTVDGGAGDDTVYGQRDDRVSGAEHTVTVEIKDLGKYFKIEGSPEFVARVQADLDMLASSPRGQEMLAALDHAHESTKAVAADWPVLGGLAYQGDTFTIKETADANGYANPNSVTLLKTWSQHPVIQYNPTFDDLYDGPPVAVLYHEMAHVYDYEYGTMADGTYTGSDNYGVPNSEREAAGLPFDDDNNPATPDRIDPDHPYDYTENGLREEMGAPHRPAY